MTKLIHEIINQLSNINLNISRPNIWVMLTAVGTLGATIIALLSSFDIFRRMYKPKQKISTGDRVEIVISSDKKVHKIHLSLTISNQRFYPITVRKIICEIKKDNSEYNLNWNLIIKPVFDKQFGLVSAPKKRPGPFTVSPRSSHDEEIEFFTDKDLIIKKGLYQGTIKLWSEVNKIDKGPTETAKFNFDIGKVKLDQFNKEKKSIIPDSKPIAMISIPIKEWSIGWEKNI